jgi:hypothetical protein
MNGHLTEQQLIDYQFTLASDAGMEQARTHLEQCEACRERLAALNRKFAALDLLREEIKPSEALIAATVETAAKARRTRVLPLSLPWLGATAAAIVVGVALLITSNEGPQSRPPGARLPAVRQLESAPAGRIEKNVAPEPESAVAFDKAKPGAYPFKQGLAESAGGRAKTEGSVRSMPARASEETPYGATTNALASSDEKPPFAPASAIELVVLPRRENVQLTIYNGADLTLVRERRNLTLKRGWNWLQFMWANTLIDPTSLTLEPLEHKDQVQVQQLVFPPRLRELGRWLIHSEISGQAPFELTYFTSGLAWRAFYMGTLAQDEKTMHLEAYVRVNNNSGEDYENAQTRLIVGRVHLLDEIARLAKRQYPYDSPMLSREGEKGGFGGMGRMKDYKLTPSPRAGFYTQSQLVPVEPKEIIKEGLSEYFLYTIEGTETIPDKWGKRLLSLEADEIPVKALYKYDEERWGTQTTQFVSFANDEEHKLGQTPLPDGMVRIYGRVDKQGHLSYVGGTNVKYIPVGEEIELNLGPARLVEVKPVLMDYRTENYRFDSSGNVNGWDEVRTWKIEVTNTRTLPVEIEITRGFDTVYWTLKQGDGSASYEKHDATHARFKLSVESRSKRSFDYVVTTYHGTRQESFAGKEKRE